MLNNQRFWPLAIVFILVAGLGVYFLVSGHAATLATSQEAENGTITGKSCKAADSSASGGNAVKFGTTSCGSGGTACTVTGYNGCGPYLYPAITPSNGYNTNVVNQDGACGGDQTGKYCGPQSMTVYNPGNWTLTSTMPAGYNGVRTYPDIGQLFNNWGGGGFNGGGGDTPVSGLKSLTSTYAETMNENSGTYAEAAYDIWTSTNEVMVWVDTTPLRGSGGATQRGTGTLAGIPFTYYVYDDGNPADPPLPIIKFNTNMRSATVDLLAAIKYFQSQGVVASNATFDQLNFGWEICSTGGIPETFSISNYTLTAVPN